MSLMGMNRAFKKHGALLAGFGALLMLIIAISGLGMNNRMGGGAAATVEPTQDVVAVVGDTRITRADLDAQIDRILQQQYMVGTPTASQKDSYRVMLLSQYKQQAALVAAAKAAGVTVSDDEIAKERDKAWAVQRPGIVSTLKLADKATDSDIDKALSDQGSGLTVEALKVRIAPDDALRAKLYEQGLSNIYKKQIKVNENDVKNSYNEIQVRHILVATGPKGLPDDKAKAKAQGLLTQVLADPSKMPALAAANTDDPGSKAKGGLYDWAPASNYVPEFTAGALAAGVGKVNPNLIKTKFGYHIIKLEGVRPGKDFPKDWDKNKQKYIDEYAEKQAQAKVQDVVNAQLPHVKQTILDPGMLAAQAQEDAESAPDPNTRNAKLNEALADLDKIKPENDPTGSAPLRRAEILMQLKRPKDAIAAYQQALNFQNSVDTRLSLADIYQGQNDKADALKQVQEAEKLAVADPTTQERIATMLQSLGATDEAARARQKASEMRKRQAELEAADKAAQAAAMPKLQPAPTGVKPSGTTPTAAATGAPAAASPAPAKAAPAPPAGTPAPAAAASPAAAGK